MLQLLGCKFSTYRYWNEILTETFPSISVLGWVYRHAFGSNGSHSLLDHDQFFCGFADLPTTQFWIRTSWNLKTLVWKKPSTGSNNIVQEKREVTKCENTEKFSQLWVPKSFDVPNSALFYDTKGKVKLWNLICQPTTLNLKLSCKTRRCLILMTAISIQTVEQKDSETFFYLTS